MAPLKKVKANAAASNAARLARATQARQALEAASARSGPPIISSGKVIPRPVKPLLRAQHVDLDVESGPGLVARVKAFLSLRGLVNTSGITSAKIVSAPVRTNRDRRSLANSVPASPSISVQRPNLKTVRPAAEILKLSRLEKARKIAERKANLKLPLLSAPVPRLLRRNRLFRTQVATSDIETLRKDLGLLVKDSKLEDAIYVSLDTEYGPGLREIGISTLDTRDIMGIKPDHRATNWISKVKHQHIAISRRSFTGAHSVGFLRKPGRRSIFCQSQYKTAADARTLLLAHLQFLRQAGSQHVVRNVHLVGQSICTDIDVLRHSVGARLDLAPGPMADFRFDKVYDTSNIAQVASKRGAPFPSHRLGHLARHLGVDPKYWDETGAVRGCHNASNDAAYTMMVMLLFAVRWESLVDELRVPAVPAKRRTLLPLLQVRVAPGSAATPAERLCVQSPREQRRQVRVQKKQAKLALKKERADEEREHYKVASVTRNMGLMIGRWLFGRVPG